MLTMELLRNQYKNMNINDAIDSLENRIFMNEMQSRMDFEFDRMLKALLKEFKEMAQ